MSAMPRIATGFLSFFFFFFCVAEKFRDVPRTDMREAPDSRERNGERHAGFPSHLSSPSTVPDVPLSLALFFGPLRMLALQCF